MRDVTEKAKNLKFGKNGKLIHYQLGCLEGFTKISEMTPREASL